MGRNVSGCWGGVDVVLPPEALAALNRLLVEFYDNWVQMELDKLQTTKPITQADLDRLQEIHPQRRVYQP